MALQITTVQNLINHLSKLDPETPCFEEDLAGNLHPLFVLPDYIYTNAELDEFSIVKNPLEANGVRYSVRLQNPVTVDEGSTE